MGEKISVIIPVYKVEAYLEECLDSLVNQTYRDTEILLVDDASPDGCGAICDRYAAEDKRIRVIHKEKNCGQASARNTALELATGEYIFFADSDDWLAEDALEKLHEGLRRYGADCSVGACVNVVEKENGKRDIRHNKQKEDRCETAQEAMRHVLLAGSAAWNRLCRREAVADLRFPLGRINDDECFILRAYSCMGKIAFLGCETYFYRRRADSITTSAFSVKMVDCFYNSQDNLKFITEKAPELIPAAEYRYCRMLLWCYVNLRRVRGDERAKTLCGELRAEIRAHRKMALSNPCLSLPMKALALICML